MAPDPQRVGRPFGHVVGTDNRRDTCSRPHVRFLTRQKEFPNVELVIDDLFASKLEPRSFDLVHARYVIAPLGRGPEQVTSHRRLVQPGGLLVLEEWDLGSWHFNPTAPAAHRLIQLISEIFAARGGEAGRRLPELFREIGIDGPRNRRTGDRASSQVTPICVCPFNSASRSSHGCLKSSARTSWPRCAAWPRPSWQLRGDGERPLL